MFSGIVETTGRVEDLRSEGSNVHFRMSATFASELKPDQSVAHDGVCLTVTVVNHGTYEVTAIAETMDRTNLSSWKKGSVVNLERCLKVGDRLDGHIVQGHVDLTATCTGIEDMDGSRKFSFRYHSEDHTTVTKGSICVNGVSLTVVDSEPGSFSVCIIPYTLDYTNFKSLAINDVVNLEFDIIGKYVQRYLQLNNY